MAVYQLKITFNRRNSGIGTDSFHGCSIFADSWWIFSIIDCVEPVAESDKSIQKPVRLKLRN